MNRRTLVFGLVASLIFVVALGVRMSWEKKPKLLISDGFAASITLSNVKQVCISMEIYASDYDDHFPYAPDTNTAEAVTYPYSKSRDIWKSMNPKGSHIEFNTGVAGVNSAKIPDPKGVVLAYDSEPWEGGGRPVGFCDGLGAPANRGQWQALADKMKTQRFTHEGKPLKSQHL